MNAADIEELRSFAIARNEVAFAHLCTAALAGEQWAVDRLTEAVDFWHDREDEGTHSTQRAMLDAIRSTDTTRPDGAIARSFVDPFAKGTAMSDISDVEFVSFAKRCALRQAAALLPTEVECVEAGSACHCAGLTIDEMAIALHQLARDGGSERAWSWILNGYYDAKTAAGNKTTS